MKKKISEVIRTATFRHTSLVTGATVINGILGFVFFWFMARVFQPAILGVFTVAVTTASLLTDILTLGTETGVVNFVGRFIKTDKEKAFRFLKLALEAKILISILILIVGWIAAPAFALNVLKKSELVIPLRFALFAAISGILFGFATSSLQSLQKFSSWGLINILSNTGRLIAVYVVFTIGLLTVNSGMIAYAVFPAIMFLISFLLLPNFLSVKKEKTVLKEFFHYAKWIAIFTPIAAATANLDIFLLSRLRPLADVGIYSVAKTLTSVIPQIVGAVGTVVAPKLAGIDTRSKTIIYLKKLQAFMGSLSILGIISGSIIGYFFIRHFYAPVYFASFSSFVILLIAQAIFLFSIPVHMAVIYYFSYPKLFVLISIIDFLIIAILGYVFIIKFGIAGAAAAILVGNISNFAIPAFWIFRKFNEK